MAFCRNCGSPVDGQFCTRCGTPAAPAQEPPGAQPFTPAYAPPPRVAPSFMFAPGVEYATWATRVLGYLIDSVLVGVVAGVLLLVAIFGFGGLASIGSGFRNDGIRDFGGSGCCCVLALFPISMLLVGLWNKVYLVAQRGSSIGQGVMKIKVVNAQGQLITQGQAALRLLVHVGLSFVPAGGLLDLLWPLWDERRQTLHDKAVGCYVITNPVG